MNKTILFCPSLLLLSLSLNAQTFILKGKVTTSDNPVAGCLVTNETKSTIEKKIATETNKNGEFSIEAHVGDKINFSLVGFSTQSRTVSSHDTINVNLSPAEGLSGIVLTGFSSSNISTRNFWAGAKIGYNFIGKADDNFFVGSASMALNLLDNNDTHHTFGVIGNIGNFKFNKDTSDTKDIQKVGQSINGLSVGLGYTHETYIKGTSEYKSNQYPTSYFRQFIQSGVRLTTFTNVGKDSLTINLAQSVTTCGLEFEQTGFKNGGSITASMAVSLYLFDKNISQQLFNEKRNNLLTMDFTVILPISKQMGFFVNGTFTKNTSAAYILGIIFRPYFDKKN